MRGVSGGIGVLVALFFALLGALGLAGFALIFGGIMLMFREEWTIANLIRPIILLISGVYYPVYLMPLWLQYIAGLIPLTYAVEATRIAIMFENPFIQQMYTFIGLILVLTIIYTPIGVRLYGVFEAKTLKEGIKT